LRERNICGGLKLKKSDFLQSFVYEKSRQSFDDKKLKYPVEYGGEIFPTGFYLFMTRWWEDIDRCE